MSPVGTEEIVAWGATVAPHVSWPRQASLGPRRFASVCRLRRAHRGHGGYCRHSGNQGTTGRPSRAHKTLQRNFSKGQALQASRGSPSLVSLSKGKPSARDLSSRGHQAKRLGEASSLVGIPSSPSQLCLLDRAHMELRSPQSHGRAKAR